VQIDIKEDSNIIIAKVAGRLDTVNSSEFQAKLEPLVSTKKNILLDFECLDYVSSAGLRCVVILAKKSAASGIRVCCFSLQPLVDKVFEVSGFSRIVPVCKSLQEALEKFS
jgi:anti-anti-sigma factor